MKKTLSIVVICTLLLGLMSVVSFADTSFSTSVPLLKVLQDGATETVEHTADANGGVTFTQTQAWMPWVTYYTDEAMALEAAAGEQLYLAFDLDIPAGAQIQFTLNGWNEPIATAMATACGKSAGIGEGGVAYLGEGTWTGAMPVNKSQIGENGRIGIMGSGITIRQFRLASAAGTPDVSEMSVDPGATQPTVPTTAPTLPENLVIGKTQDLIEAIGNGSNEDDTTEIKDEGQGFIINQLSEWNVWVLYYTEESATFTPDEGEALYLVYDFTVEGSGHLCLNGWTQSVAAAIAKVAGKGTTPAEDGTPMLTKGTYKGMIPITADTIGENGRLGIVGSGATIRQFQLASVSEGEPSATTTTKAGETTTTAAESGDPSSDVTLGDANGDNSVDMKDVLAIRKVIANMGGEINEAASDVNRDNSVDMKDVLQIRKFIANMIESF